MSNCPKAIRPGAPCPNGYTDVAWCDICKAETTRALNDERRAQEILDEVEEDDAQLALAGVKKHLKTLPPLTSSSPSAPTTQTRQIPAHGMMLVQVMAARFDSHCKACRAPIKAGEMIAGVRPSFYDDAPLRWLCVDCGELYEDAYKLLRHDTNHSAGATRVVSNNKQMLTFEWDDLEDKWRELRVTAGSVRRRRP